MKHIGPQFPLVNRIAVFVMSCVVLATTVLGFTMPSVRQSPDVVTGFVFVVFAAVGCGGIWLSLAWRPRTASDVEAGSRVDRSAIPHDAITCRFPTGFANSKSGAIIVDPKKGVIHFENCHVPRRFLAVAEPWFTCPLSDVRGVHRFRYRSKASLPFRLYQANHRAARGSARSRTSPSPPATGREHPPVSAMRHAG